MPRGGFFVFVAIFGGLLAVRSTTWVFCFIGFVINRLGVVPLLVSATSSGWKIGEVAVKYFLVQRIGRVCYAVGGVVYYDLARDSGIELVGHFLIVVGVMIKLGVFPFHV